MTRAVPTDSYNKVVIVHERTFQSTLPGFQVTSMSHKQFLSYYQWLYFFIYIHTHAHTQIYNIHISNIHDALCCQIYAVIFLPSNIFWNGSKKTRWVVEKMLKCNNQQYSGVLRGPSEGSGLGHAHWGKPSYQTWQSFRAFRLKELLGSKGLYFQVL